MKKRIGVIGSGQELNSELTGICEKIGEQIAERDCILLCGGREGIMNACARGAKKAGGLVVGILPGSTDKDANSFVDIAIPTGLSHARNSIVATASNALIVIKGGCGTLSEIGMALCYKKPVVAVKGTGGVAGMLEKNTELPQDILKNIRIETPDKAVDLALELIGQSI